MPDMNDYYAFKSTSGGDENGTGGGGKLDFGCGWVVIVIVVYAFLHALFSGESIEVLDRILGFGLIAFLFARSLFR